MFDKTQPFQEKIDIFYKVFKRTSGHYEQSILVKDHILMMLLLCFSDILSSI
jgi:hypothetical protein